MAKSFVYPDDDYYFYSYVGSLTHTDPFHDRDYDHVETFREYNIFHIWESDEDDRIWEESAVNPDFPDIGDDFEALPIRDRMKRHTPTPPRGWPRSNRSDRKRLADYRRGLIGRKWDPNYLSK
ncbi:MAG TPA: hypothetical protein VEC37_02845 [Bacillota bacterium]|nr:hypothetical protein [Bacillota bacterium]